MRQILSRSLLTVAAASSVLAVGGGYAHADSDAHGGAKGSPGVLAGNSVEIPVNAPVNVCGNTVDAVALLNPAFGNSCENGAKPVASSVSAPPPQHVVPPPQHVVPPQRHHHAPPVTPSAPPAPQVAPPVATPARVAPRVSTGLAETGMSSGELGAAAATSAALLLGGAMLYRRAGRTSRIQRTYS